MSKALPRILVIDDVLGGSAGERNRHREDFCVRLALQDVTGDVAAERVDTPAADAVFASGQRITNETVENDPEQTLEDIRRGWLNPPRWALVLLDLHFKTGRIGADGVIAERREDRVPEYYFGLQLLREARRDSRLAELPVVILSSMNRSEAELMFAELDAKDFADKSRIDEAWLREELFYHGLIEDERIAGRSLTLLLCMREARRRSRRENENILMLGETGVGKELLAAYVHRSSSRRGQLVSFFAPGGPETLVESELFGHERGAFTGATERRIGAAEEAREGTLFIDEFGDIPQSVQVKLLRLLDPSTREIQRLGSPTAQRLDLLVVMATNRIDIAGAGDFRDDLLIRAKGKTEPIVLPPLRERREDIPLLAERFVRDVERELGAERREISAGAMAALLAHDWPGNIRQLKSAVERAVHGYPGLRYLVEGHLQLTAGTQAPASVQSPARPVETSVHQSPRETEPVVHTRELEALLDLIQSHDPNGRSDLSGGLPRLEDAYHRLLVRYLKAGLESTRRPGGEVNRQAAMRLLTGDDRLKGAQPADLVKKLVNRNEKAKAEALQDPDLRSVYEASEKVRSSRRKAKR